MKAKIGEAGSQGSEGIGRLLGLFRWANLVLVDGDQLLVEWEELGNGEGAAQPNPVLVRFRLLDGTPLELTATSAEQAQYEGETDLYTQCAEGADVRLRFYRLHAAGRTGTEGKGRLVFAP